MVSPPFPCLIRSATEADLPALVKLLQELFAIEADFTADPARQERGLRLLMENPNSQVWIADHAGQVVGMCRCKY